MLLSIAASELSSGGLGKPQPSMNIRSANIRIPATVQDSRAAFVAIVMPRSGGESQRHRERKFAASRCEPANSTHVTKSTAGTDRDDPTHQRRKFHGPFQRVSRLRRSRT